VFVQLPNTMIELLHPLGQKSPIQKFLERNPAGGIHHICLEVNDVTASMEGLGKRIRVLNPEPKTGAHGNPVSDVLCCQPGNDAVHAAVALQKWYRIMVASRRLHQGACAGTTREVLLCQ
jgi:hypothetical protein